MSKCWITLWTETASFFEEISVALESTNGTSVSLCFLLLSFKMFSRNRGMVAPTEVWLGNEEGTTSFIQQILGVSKSNQNIQNEKQGKKWHQSRAASVLLSLIHCILHWHTTMCLQPKGCSLTPRAAAAFHSASQMSTVWTPSQQVNSVSPFILLWPC